MPDLIYIIILSFFGFVNSYYLHWQYLQFKKTNKPMFCLIGGDCAAVIDSPYGASFGIKNEIIGIVYYVMIALFSVLALISIPILSFVSILIFILALAAAIFSVYLFYVQTKVLRKICSWCLIAIFLNLIIFVFAVRLII